MILRNTWTLIGVGLPLILGLQIGWTWIPAKTNIPRRFKPITLVLTLITWFAIVIASIWVFWDESKNVEFWINNVKNAVNALIARYNRDCGCVHIDFGGILSTEVGDIVDFGNDGLHFALPAITGIVIVGSVSLLFVLFGASQLTLARGHVMRMVAFSVLLVVFGTALVTASALADAFRYIRTNMENSNNNIVKVLTGKISCSPHNWNYPHIPDPSCVRSYEIDPPAGCIYTETFIAVSLIPSTVPGHQPFLLDVRRPGNDSALGPGYSDDDETPVDCLLRCFCGPPEDDNVTYCAPGSDVVTPYICNAQAAVEGLLSHDIDGYEQGSHVLVWGVLLSSLLLLLLAELIDPSRDKLITTSSIKFTPLTPVGQSM